MNPFLRWSGGKRRHLAKMVSLCPENFNSYYEPFVGAGCLFFALSPGKAFLSDANRHIVRCYSAIKEDASAVANYLASIPHSESAYYAVRKILPDQLADDQAAARFIFLMKSCFNGVYRENQSGVFNTPWGGKVYRLPEDYELMGVSSRLQKAELSVGDFEVASSTAKANDFLYMDPPYPQERYRGEYGVAPFDIASLTRFIAVCKKLSGGGVKIMVSYIYSERLLAELSDWEVTEFTTNTSVGGRLSSRRPMREILLRNYK